MLGVTKRLIYTLEDTIRDLRADYGRRLEERDAVIAKQEERIAQLEAENLQMRLVLLPYGTTAGAQLAQRLKPKKAPLPVVGEGVPDYQTELRSGSEAEVDV